MIKFGKKNSLTELENTLRSAESIGFNIENPILVSSKSDKKIINDTWSAMALGTLLQKNPCSEVMIWGSQSKLDVNLNTFSTSKKGLVSTHLASKLLNAQSKKEIETNEIKDWLLSNKKGFLDGQIRGDQRILFETGTERAKIWDDYHSPTNKSHLERKTYKLSKRSFENLYLSIRKDLEIDYSDQTDLFSKEKDEAIDKISNFIKEIFENSIEHGISAQESNSFRYLSIRKIIRPSSEQLLRLADKALYPLSEFLIDHTKKSKSPFFVEICVSDFGPGILDSFLESNVGVRYKHLPRYEILCKLLYERLSSKTLDPASGLGIRYALEAASKLGAFVSLRTNEFWLGKAYTRTKTKDIFLDPIASDHLAKISGSHWQIVWTPQV